MVEETTALTIRRIDEIERKDEAQILAAMAGELIEEYTYSFKDGKGRPQRSLSWAGIREMAQMRGNISIDDVPIVEETDDHWRVMCKATDILRNVSVWGGTHQPKIMTVTDKDTGERYEVPDTFAFQKGLAKAQRNAIKNLMPVTVIEEIIKRLTGESKHKQYKPKASQKVTKPSEASRREEKPSPDVEEELPPNVEEELFGPKPEDKPKKKVQMIFPNTRLQFYAACKNLFGLNQSEALKATGTGVNDISDWKDAFIQVAGVMGAIVDEEKGTIEL